MRAKQNQETVIEQTHTHVEPSNIVLCQEQIQSSALENSATKCVQKYVRQQAHTKYAYGNTTQCYIETHTDCRAPARAAVALF